MSTVSEVLLAANSINESTVWNVATFMYVTLPFTAKLPVTPKLPLIETAPPIEPPLVWNEVKVFATVNALLANDCADVMLAFCAASTPALKLTRVLA